MVPFPLGQCLCWGRGRPLFGIATLRGESCLLVTQKALGVILQILAKVEG